MEVNIVELETLYLGYSGVAVKVGGVGLLFDPSNMVDSKTMESLAKCKPLIILYTHDHYDHYNAEALKTLTKKLDCKVIVEPAMTGKLKGIVEAGRLHSAEHGKTLEVEGVKVTGVRGKHVGPITLYLVEASGVRIFHGGDSGYVDLSKLSPVDLAIIPCGAPSPTASPRDAYRMALDLKPKHVMAVHGSEAEMEELKGLLAKELPSVGFTAAKAGGKYVFKW
jgi:L-ascorbate metabolism protein UlaG (beta-lactamase superfamily)